MILLVIFLLSFSGLVTSQFAFLEPSESRYTINDPATECSNIFKFYTWDGRFLVSPFYRIVEVDPLTSIGSTDPFSILPGNIFSCRADQITESSYRVLVEASGDTIIQKSITVTFSSPTPLTLSVPTNTLSIPKDLFEVEESSNIPSVIGFQFNVSDSAAVVTLHPVPPDTDDVPFVAILEDGQAGTYYLSLNETISTRQSPYTFTIRATLSGTSKEQNIIVTLLQRPVFTSPYDQGSFTQSIEEDISSSASILRLSGTDPDLDPLTFTVVSVLPPSKVPLFVVEGTDLRTVENIGDALDVDQGGQELNLTLTVRVSDGTLYSDTSVIILVTDVNDNKPIFNGTEFSAMVLETAPSGDVVLTVEVSDADISSPNNDFEVSLSGTGNDHFAINDTGSITIASPSQLDYSTTPVYNLIITATDKAAQNPLSSTASLTVSLETAPEFTNPPDTASMDENIGPNTTIVTYQATDEDTNDPSTLQFTVDMVHPYSGGGLFAMDGPSLQTSASVTTDTFDLEVSGGDPVLMFTVDVTVSDGKYTSMTSVNVTIKDVNDKTPTFTDPPYSVEVLQETPAGDVILTVDATDDDYSSPNKDIKYSLSGTGNDHFAINDTGSITIASPSQLDYSTTPVYNLIITATDKAVENPRSSTASLTVSLETAPRFTTPSDDTTVVTASENTGPSVSIFSCVVDDEDTDVNTLDISLKSVMPASGTGLFQMDGVLLKTGTGVTTSTFDLEANGAIQSYVVDISVTDGKYSADTKVTVNITDVNDNTPQFSGPITQDINEDLAIGQDVVQVVATDADVSTAFNSVTYSIIASNNQDHTAFQIDPSSGSITLQMEPRKAAYNFTVKASDVDNREDFTTVYVSVEDTVDECGSSPCQNGGSCFRNINYYFCLCVNGWTGVNCQTNIDDCSPNPCQNNGECTDGLASYACNCSNGWTGDTCTQSCTNNKYGRNCEETCMCNETRLATDTQSQQCNITTGACFCNAQWTGNLCEMDVDECTQDTTLCTDLANRICVNNDGSYTCECRQGFSENASQICVAETESTTVTLNAGETVVKGRFTQNYDSCPNLAIQGIYDALKVQIEAAEMVRLPTANDVQASDLSCGSITYDLAIVINDTSAAKTSLAYDLNAISTNERPLILNNQPLATTAMTVAGKTVPINSSTDITVQICDVFTAYSPCGSSYECRINAGTPFCQKKDEDRTGLILALALGVPLGTLAIVGVVVIACYLRRSMTENINFEDTNRRQRDHGHKESSKRQKQIPSSNHQPTYEEVRYNTSYLPYTPSLLYDNSKHTRTSGHRSGEADPRDSNNDWIFYSPATRNGPNSFHYNEKF